MPFMNHADFANSYSKENDHFWVFWRTPSNPEKVFTGRRFFDVEPIYISGIGQLYPDGSALILLGKSKEFYEGATAHVLQA